jgi:hypothetical protein
LQDYLEAMSQYRRAAQLEQNIGTAKQIGKENCSSGIFPGE